ncbi:snare associated Golgi protein-domain-containing protein, partial [Dichotomocladium elegans]
NRHPIAYTWKIRPPDSGYVLMSFLIFLSAFPPIIGYSLFQTLSGFTFGFAKGFPISYCSALLGSIVCFTVSRIWLKGWVTRLMTRYPNLEVVVHAVEKKGFKLFLLIRLSPYPFNLLNVLFAATNISLFNFALGTAISLTKIALHIYIGANLTSFAKHLMGDDEDMSESDRRAETARIIAAALGSVLAFAVMIYIYFVAKRAIKQVEQGELNGEESMAFLSHQEVGDADAASLEDWMEWNDDDDDESMDHTYPTSRDLESGRN